MADHISEHLKPHSQTLAHMFTVGCQDAVVSVAVEALSAAGNFIMQLGDAQEVMSMQGVISPMLNAMNKCLAGGEEDFVVEGLDVIQQCCELEQPLINEHIEVSICCVVIVIIIIMIFFLSFFIINHRKLLDSH